MMPDYPLGETLDFKFTSRSTTGAPTTLAGTPAVHVYEDNGLTQITAGITLTADFDSVTGLNNLRIVATSGNGYESGKSYQAVISAGTVGGTSVVGEVVAQFSVERSPALRPTVAGRTLDVAASGEAGVDFGNVSGTLTNANLAFVDSNERIDVGEWLGNAVTFGTGGPDVNVNAVSDDTAAAVNMEAAFDGAGYNVGAGLIVASSVSGDVTVGTIQANTITAGSIAAGALDGKGDWNIGKTGYSISGTKTTLDALNDFDPTTEDVVLANNSSHGGPNAVIALSSMSINSSSQHGLSIITSAANKDAIHLEANGSGTPAGLNAFGNTYGVVMSNAAASSGNGLRITSNGPGDAVDIFSSSGDAFAISAASGDPTMPADVQRLDGDETAPANLKASALGIITGSASGTPTVNSTNTDLTGYLDDELIGRVIVFTSGTAAGQAAAISDYAATDGVVTFAVALATAPAASDDFVIV